MGRPPCCDCAWAGCGVLSKYAMADTRVHRGLFLVVGGVGAQGLEGRLLVHAGFVCRDLSVSVGLCMAGSGLVMAWGGLQA